MAPKIEIRNKLADALDVDLSALSDINIQTYEDIMHTLFLFKEEFDMDIDRTEEKTTLSFDNHNKKIAPLITYLYTWHCNKKDLSNQVTTDLEQYKSWKGRFPKDINEYWTKQKNKIESLYTPYIKELSKVNKPIYTISEFIELLRVPIKHNLSIEVGIKSYDAGDSALVLNFFVKEMLNTDILAVNRDFAKFLYTIKTIETYGMTVYTSMLTNECGTQVSYTLRLPTLTCLIPIITNIQQYELNKDTINNWYTEMFELQHKKDLASFNINIKSEIEANY